MVFAQPRIHSQKWDAQTPWDFEMEKDHRITDRRPDQVILKEKKKKTCRIVDFAVPADHSVKLKEIKKWDR